MSAPNAPTARVRGGRVVCAPTWRAACMRWRPRDERGQATLEYMLTGLMLIAMIGALGALWRYASDGGFSQLLQASASHALAEAGGVADALLF